MEFKHVLFNPISQNKFTRNQFKAGKNICHHFLLTFVPSPELCLTKNCVLEVLHDKILTLKSSNLQKLVQVRRILHFAEHVSAKY